MYLLETITGKIVHTIDISEGEVRRVCFSPDGRTLAVATGSDVFGETRGEIGLFDVSTGKRLRAWAGHFVSTTHMAFSPDGSILATGGCCGGIRVYDALTGRQLYQLANEKSGQLGEGSDCIGLAFLPDGSALLTRNTNGKGSAEPLDFREPRTGKIIPFKPNR